VARPRIDKARAAALLGGLGTLYPDATCELDHRSPYQLLCATILSAQCTDARVNLVTPELFRRWPTPRALAAASQAEVEKVIQSTGFFRNKAKSLRGMARVLVDRFGGEVPRTMEEMLELPGVARKTANVVLGTAYGLATGVVVDTHVQRLSRRLGLSREEDPKKIERDLMALLPEEEWVGFAHRLIWHGRRVCTARSPRCGVCPLPCPSRLESGPGEWGQLPRRRVAAAAGVARRKRA
jgi:endonuclease-3